MGVPGRASNAPRSHAGPCGRVTLRASTATGQAPDPSGGAASSAALPAPSAIVSTVPGAFAASGPSSGSPVSSEPVPDVGHLVGSPTRSAPTSTTGSAVAARQSGLFGALLPATIESVMRAVWRTLIPPPKSALLPATVTSSSSSALLPWGKSPPARSLLAVPSAVFPAIVTSVSRTAPTSASRFTAPPMPWAVERAWLPLSVTRSSVNPPLATEMPPPAATARMGNPVPSATLFVISLSRIVSVPGPSASTAPPSAG